MTYLDSLIKEKKPTTYQWQDEALHGWDKLGLGGKVSSQFFRCFKLDMNRAIQAVLAISDSDSYDIEKLFYWKYHSLKTKKS